jgi:predicted SAM-dependent methyltransferase
LEDHPDGKSFPTVLKTFKEVYRVLKPGGVLTILNETPENLNGNWYAQLYPQISKRYEQKLPSHKQIKEMLVQSGFAVKSVLKTLWPSFLPEYDHLGGPLEESWRNENSFWTVFTESETQEMIKKVTEMKNNGSLQGFFDKQNNIETVGTYEIFAAKKE